MIDYKDNKSEIKNLIILLDKLSPADDTFQYLMNELLIQVYASYENFLKTLLVELFSDAKKNYKYSPFLIEHNLWSVVEEDSKRYIVPKGKIEDLLVNFPLLKSCYFANDLSSIDTLVNERNSFAHTGTHKATLEQILTAFITTQYVIKYLDFCYIKSTAEDIKKLAYLQVFLNVLRNHPRKCLKRFKGEYIHENMNAFDIHITNYRKLESEGVFSIHPDITLLLNEETLLFLINCRGMLKTDFEQSLNTFENLLYIKAFNVPDKDKLTTKIILDSIFDSTS